MVSHSINIYQMPTMGKGRRVGETDKSDSELRDSTETLHVKSHYKEKELHQRKNLLRHDNYGECLIQCNKVILYPRKVILLPKYYSQPSVYANICI